MRNFWILLKVSFLQNAGINKLIHTKSKRNIYLRIFSFILLFLFVYAMIFFQYYQIASLFNQSQNMESFLATVLLAASIFILIGTIGRANSFIFKQSDYELLGSMPLSRHSIVLSKITSFLFLNYLTEFIFLLPGLILYGYFSTITVHYVIVSVLVFLLLPLVFISIFSFISYLLSILFNRFRIKNLLSILVSLIFVVGIMMASFLSSQGAGISEKYLKIIEILNLFFYPSSMAKEALLGDYVMLSIFIAINIVAFILFVFITSKFYLSIHKKLSTQPKSKKLTAKDYKFKSSNQLSLLIKREFKRYFSIPAYVINSIIGPILMPVITLLLYYSLSPIADEALPMDTSYIHIIAIVTTLFVGFINLPTTASISLEGKTLWILKSSPIDYKKFYLSKGLFSVLLATPFIVLTTVLYAVLFKMSLIYVSLSILILILATFLFSFLGLFFNALFPKFDFTNPIKVIKSGASTIMNMLVSFALEIITGVSIYFIVSGYDLSAVYILYLIVMFLSLYSIILLILYKKFSRKLYLRFTA